MMRSPADDEVVHYDLHFEGPDRRPVVAELPVGSDATIPDPYVAFLTVWLDLLATWRASDPINGVELLVRPDVSMEIVGAAVRCTETRLTRLWNPDGSEPDSWRDLGDGRIRATLVAIELPPRWSQRGARPGHGDDGPGAQRRTRRTQP